MEAIRSFEESDVEAAGRLLADRHARDRSAHPLLPARFTDAGRAAAAVRATLENDGLGVVAFAGADPAGYLVGRPLIDTLRGRAMWIDIAAHASVRADLYLDMYARVAEHWIRRGCFEHYVLVPADPEVADAWFRLGFGMQQVHALVGLDAVRLGVPAAVSIRRAGPEDVNVIEPFVDLIHEHQAGAPVFAARLPEVSAGFVDGHAQLLRDGTVGYFIAERDGEPAGYLAMIPHEPGPADLLIAEGCIELAVAGTVGDHRRSGVMTALTNRAFDWARSEGYEVCITDWRSANLLSSRYWPRFGFRPAAYRLHRTVDARSAWAR